MIAYTVCPAGRVEDLERFIDTHWRKDHILTQHRELLNWQYRNNRGDYNFVLATDEDEELQGIFGFIPTSQFSKSLPENDDVWLAIWKVRDDCKIPGLGLGMMNYAEKTLGVKFFCAFGMSDIVKPIYQALDFTLGALNHYVAFNVFKEKFHLVSPVDKPLIRPTSGDLNIQEMSRSDLENLTAEDQKFLFSGYPQKDAAYLVNRFLVHPIYSYRLLAFYNIDNVLRSLIILRIVDVEQTRVARIVDAFGDSFINSDYNQCIYTLLADENCEYLDCMAHGLNRDQIDDSCFEDVKDTEGLIIPNYFEPLVISNITLEFAYKTKRIGDVRIFKGDSDQDRPNQI